MKDGIFKKISDFIDFCVSCRDAFYTIYLSSEEEETNGNGNGNGNGSRELNGNDESEHIAHDVS